VVTLAFTMGVLVADSLYADSARQAIFSSQIYTAHVTVKNVRIKTSGNDLFPYAPADLDARSALQSIPGGSHHPPGAFEHEALRARPIRTVPRAVPGWRGRLSAARGSGSEWGRTGSPFPSPRLAGWASMWGASDGL
jgi:hypothetical protein